jgi:hypothetical protein
MNYLSRERGYKIQNFIKNGYYIHFLHLFMYYLTDNIYVSSIISIKLYSVNYFYWYGYCYSYLQNKKYNWIKQFIRFTDTGHIASVLAYFYPRLIPLCQNVHFIIMFGYWCGKLAFDMKDADRICNADVSDIVEWHMDICTYIHHTIPYMLMILLMLGESKSREVNCEYEYNNTNLRHTYIWLYTWFIFIYMPWRIYTGDTVYSILDFNQTPKHISLYFIGFIHFLVFLSNTVGYAGCKMIKSF